MATTESAGRPPLPRTTSNQSAKSAESVATSGHSSSHSQSSQLSKSNTSAEQQTKPHQGSPKSSKPSTEKQGHEQAESTPVSELKGPGSPTATTKKKEIIDMSTFSQILELDDDETRDFSRSMVNDYYSQVDATLIKMDNALETKDLKQLSDLGHFLKGSSAALGVERVQTACERIQHAGKLWDEENRTELTESQALELINTMLEKVKNDYPEARDVLNKFFDKSAT